MTIKSTQSKVMECLFVVYWHIPAVVVTVAQIFLCLPVSGYSFSGSFSRIPLSASNNLFSVMISS